MNQHPDPAAERPQDSPETESKHIPYGGYPPHHGYGYQGGYYGSPYYGESPQDETGPIGLISTARLWKLLRRKTLLIASVTVFGFAAAYFYVQKTTIEIYRANSVIEMSLRKPRVLARTDIVADDGYASSEEAFQTRLAKFSSPAMLPMVIEKLRGLRKDESRSDEQLRNMVAGSVSIKVRSMTRLVDISFTSTDPKFAADVVNAFAAAAETNVFVENKVTSDRSVAWLQTQAQAQRNLLAAGELEVAKYRADNNLDVIEGQKNSTQQSIATLSAEIARLSGDIVLQNELLNFLTALKIKPTNVDSLPSKIPGGEQIAKLVEEQQVAETALQAMAKRYTPDHPDMKSLQAKIGGIHAKLLEGIRTAMKSISTDLDLLRKQAGALQENMAAEQRKLSELDQHVVAVKAQLKNMERERDAEDSAYKGILTRIEEARLSADENTALVRIVEPAQIPVTPFTPPALPLLLFGCLIGLAGGFGLALVSDTLEDRVASIADVERVIGLKVLGLIPKIANTKRSQLALASLSHEFGVLTEAFAGIRSILNSGQYQELTHSILLASSAPAEGKTTISCNLAIGSAQSGRRTLLVDFDMRRPRLANIFGRPKPNQSLLKVLADGDVSKFDDLPMPTDCKNLYVISTRSPDEANQAEVMAGKSVPEFFKWAAQNYERIIVDSPPFGIVSDAAVLATLVGCVILVCRPERTRKRNSRHAVRHFNAMGAKVIGAIVNCVDFRRNNMFSSDYYQGQYYRSGSDYYYQGKSHPPVKRRWWQRAPADTDPDVARAPGKTPEADGAVVKVPPQ